MIDMTNFKKSVKWDYIGYCQRFNHETRSTDEIMRELREGEE